MKRPKDFPTSCVTDGMRDQAQWLASIGREDLADDLFRTADRVDELDWKSEKY